MESHHQEHQERAGRSQQNKTKPAGSPSTSVLKPRPKTLSPTKRPRNLRVLLENVDYRESCYTSDLFSIELALARMSDSKCINLLRTPPAHDSAGKTDKKLTVLRSLIDYHLLHCQHCRDQVGDLEYFKPQPQQTPQPQQPEESPDKLLRRGRVTTNNFNLTAEEISRLWDKQDQYIDLLESRLRKTSQREHALTTTLTRRIRKEESANQKLFESKKLKVSQVNQIQDLKITKSLDAGNKQPHRSLLKRHTHVIGKNDSVFTRRPELKRKKYVIGTSDSVITIPIKKSRETDTRDAETVETDPLEIIGSKISGDYEQNIENIETGDDYRKEEEVMMIDKNVEDMEFKEELFSSIQENEIPENIEPEQNKVKPESASTSSTSLLKLRSFSELSGAAEPSAPSAAGCHSWTMTEGEFPETPESGSAPQTSSEVGADTFVPALGGAVTPIAPGSRVMSSKVLRMTDVNTGLPSGVYSLVKPDKSKAVVIVKKSEGGEEVGEEVGTGKKSLYKSPLSIYIEDVKKELKTVTEYKRIYRNIKEAPTEEQIVKIAMKRWSKMSEDQKQFYKRLSEANVLLKDEPQGISLPRSSKRLMLEDPSLPQGWSRNLHQVENKQNKSIEIGVFVVTADKVRLFNKEGLKKYLAKHPYTDIDPDSISFNPYKQSNSQLSDSHDHREFAQPKAYREMGSQIKSAGTIKLSIKALKQADSPQCDAEDSLALNDATEEIDDQIHSENAEESGQNLELFSSFSSLEEIYGKIE